VKKSGESSLLQQYKLIYILMYSVRHPLKTLTSSRDTESFFYCLYESKKNTGEKPNPLNTSNIIAVVELQVAWPEVSLSTSSPFSS